MELVQRPLELPFGEAPEGTDLVCQVVIGQRKDGSFTLEERLPSGMAFDANNPAHMFGLFIVQNAQQLMGLAIQARDQAKIQQQNEIIVTNQLPH